jgi:hypothetical protein
MSARTDLDNALQYVTDGITAHVAALAASRTAAGDTTHFVELTAKLKALGDVLVASEAAV